MVGHFPRCYFGKKIDCWTTSFNLKALTHMGNSLSIVTKMKEMTQSTYNMTYNVPFSDASQEGFSLITVNIEMRIRNDIRLVAKHKYTHL